MRKSLLVTVAAVALIAGPGMASAGENDLGLEASGNGTSAGGNFKGRAETTGAGQSFGEAVRTDSRAAANPRSNNQDTGRVETETNIKVKPPTVGR